MIWSGAERSAPDFCAALLTNLSVHDILNTSRDDIVKEVRILNERKRKYAMAGGLFGLLYLLANRLLPGVPDVLMGAVLVLGILFFILALAPEKTRRKVRKWKRRGD